MDNKIPSPSPSPPPAENDFTRWCEQRRRKHRKQAARRTKIQDFLSSGLDPIIKQITDMKRELEIQLLPMQDFEVDLEEIEFMEMLATVRKGKVFVGDSFKNQLSEVFWELRDQEDSFSQSQFSFVSEMPGHLKQSIRDELRKYDCTEMKLEQAAMGRVKGYKGDETHFKPCKKETPRLEKSTLFRPDQAVFSPFVDWSHYFDDCIPDKKTIEWPDDGDSTEATATLRRTVDVYFQRVNG